MTCCGASLPSWAGKRGRRLDRAFFARPTPEVACSLIGCLLHTRIGDGETCGRIVETEAYRGPDDPASHAARLARGRLVMAGRPGVAYVYRSYGIHAMLNVVCEPEGEYGAVLIRALEPVAGLPLMTARRGGLDGLALCAGPGRLCQAMGIRLGHDGADLVEGEEIWLAAGDPPAAIAVSGRIGISRGQETLWRFFEAGSPFVSVHRRGTRLLAGDRMTGNGARNEGRTDSP